MFESISNFISDKVSTIYHGVVDTGREVITTVHEDIKAYASGVKSVADNLVNKGGDVIVHGEDTIGDVGKSFAWPLTIGAAAIATMYLMKK